MAPDDLPAEGPELAGEELTIGPLHTADDPEVSEAERSVLSTFCELHHLSVREVRATSLRGPSGSPRAIALVVPIATMRSLARSTGKLSATDAPVFERDGYGFPAAATVRVRRTDVPRGMARTAFWHERAPVLKPGEEAGRWLGEPDTVLAEVAEALALRGAFPQVLEGVYTEADLSEALRDQELGKVRARSELRRQLDALR